MSRVVVGVLTALLNLAVPQDVPAEVAFVRSDQDLYDYKKLQPRWNEHSTCLVPTLFVLRHTAPALT